MQFYYLKKLFVKFNTNEWISPLCKLFLNLICVCYDVVNLREAGSPHFNHSLSL
jgi:hypothetical protein